MKKIVFITPSLRGGGAERVVVHLLRHMNRDNIKLGLIALKLEGPYVSHLPDDAEIVDLGTRRVRHSIGKLIKELNRMQPDVVVSTLGHLNVALLALRPFLKNKPKIVLREANAPSFAMRKGKGGVKLYRTLYRMFYPKADRVIALSRGMADDLLSFSRMPKDKISIIHNPVVTEEIKRQADEPLDHPWLREKGAGRELPVCISVGRLVEQKNYDMLLRSFAKAVRQTPARLIILGEGPKREHLTALIKELGLEDKVELAGFTGNPYAYMARADLFVMSSSFEGMPNVLLEALAVGLPAVATDCIGVPDVLDDGRYGTMIPVGAEDALAEAIVNALQQQTADIGDRQRERAKQFHIEKIAGEYRQLLTSV
ncbi:glycosyltransferase [Paenibacillus tarimensis]|uniref:glycosyltransferase n=1 Tax=Paenibacillus tarimensis TaxID=416012 RepID=UPI001F422E0F|nr:glycosyltransferase [Paenibacillus tarimensis]MCF2944973.1 glycosyltransferase [Paenibacillus tarimensis]